MQNADVVSSDAGSPCPNNDSDKGTLCAHGILIIDLSNNATFGNISLEIAMVF